MNVSVYKEVHTLSQRLPSLCDGQVKSIKAADQKVKVIIKTESGYWSNKDLIFEIRTKKYPKSPCKVICRSKILHPNILEIDGEVCLSIFDEDWNPNMRLDDYVLGILFILHHPNFDDPLSDYFCIAREQGKMVQAINSLASTF
ncbi:hypothetical protein SteCoe_35826 [Stentor coeruleus]|uniref:UBC core domain-containing protein n=1 Tax=Stentor coeruleus TaxID=5963 RepID=A0A1R2ARD7_9CILI|nr:hypothetical protein SteCoe_35826 [Stentor coeruleus]